MPKPPLQPVIIVDDDENDLLLVRRLLEKSGVAHPVLEFVESEDALAVLKASALTHAQQPHLTPCLLITDVKMPGFSGFDLIKAMREVPELKEVKVAVISGSDDPRDLRRATELGALGYFQKFPEPARISALLAACN